MKQGEDAVGILLDALNGLGLDYMVVGSFSFLHRKMVRRARNSGSAGGSEGRGGDGVGG